MDTDFGKGGGGIVVPVLDLVTGSGCVKTFFEILDPNPQISFYVDPDIKSLKNVCTHPNFEG